MRSSPALSGGSNQWPTACSWPLSPLLWCRHWTACSWARWALSHNGCPVARCCHHAAVAAAAAGDLQLSVATTRGAPLAVSEDFDPTRCWPGGRFNRSRCRAADDAARRLPLPPPGAHALARPIFGDRSFPSCEALPQSACRAATNSQPPRPLQWPPFPVEVAAGFLSASCVAVSPENARLRPV